MLKFFSFHDTPVWLAISWYSPGCPSGPWETAGWWEIHPAAGVVVSDADLDDINRYWYFYAVAHDGKHWSGPFGINVPPTAFNWCEHTLATTTSTVRGFRELDIGDNDTCIVKLVD
ncbi:MAG: DUF1036 domain-containing protein [Actinobacteria bacterium]|nr:DUF1036 domain-containing protein [Actinomycetota bacterium]